MTARERERKPPYRLVIVDDSPFYRVRFAKAFAQARDLVVVGVAADGEEAVHMLADLKPDVLLLDLVMPRMDGFAVLRWVMSHAPLPVVVCSSRGDRESVFRALELGAVDFVTKPEAGRDAQKDLETRLVDRVTAASTAKLGRRERPASSKPLGLPSLERPVEMIAIAASTGGPAALQTLARQLPKELDVPVVVAQHMPRGFTRMFAERLARQSHYAAVEARDGAALAKGTIFVAPGGMQTRIVDGEKGVRFAVTPREESAPHSPSADALFESAAEVFGAATLAVVLTGMGDDGSRGAAAVKAKGGTVLVESRDTALIFGMPRATVATGTVDAQLPLSRMPEAFLALTRG